MRVWRLYRVALQSAVIIGAGSAGLTYGVASIAHTAGTPAKPAEMPAEMPAGMVMARPSTVSAAAGVIVRLRQHTVRVTIKNFTFQPARLVVSPGTRIIWTNRDSDPHTVDGTKGAWASDALDTDSQFARVFAKAGTFPYYCGIHPFMHGVVTVRR